MVLKGGEMGGWGKRGNVKEQVRGKVVLKRWKCEGTGEGKSGLKEMEM